MRSRLSPWLAPLILDDTELRHFSNFSNFAFLKMTLGSLTLKGRLRRVLVSRSFEMLVMRDSRNALSRSIYDLRSNKDQRENDLPSYR